MGHVILKEFFVDRQVPYFVDYVQAVHRPAVPGPLTLPGRGTGFVPGKFLTAADLGRPTRARRRAAVQDRAAGRRHRRAGVPNGSLGDRFGRAGMGRWNLDLGDVDPALSLTDTGAAPARSRSSCRASTTPTAAVGAAPRRAGPPVGGRLVTTVFDLLLAQYGVARRACRAAGRPATTTRRAVHAGLAGAASPGCRPRRRGSAREFAQNAEESGRPLDDPHGRRRPTTGSTPTRSTGRSSR